MTVSLANTSEFATSVRDSGLDPVLRALLPRVRHWGDLWDQPDLAERVSISFSPRLTRSLGRTNPSRGVVRLAVHLQDAPPETLEEVLCHEVAHVAVHHRHGPGAKPHGPEWADYVRKAGFEPRVKAPAVLGDEGRGGMVKPPAPQAAATFEHRCPVCHTTRLARRPMPSWRCAECLDAGLPGRMLITHHNAAAPAERDTPSPAP